MMLLAGDSKIKWACLLLPRLCGPPALSLFFSSSVSSGSYLVSTLMLLPILSSNPDPLSGLQAFSSWLFTSLPPPSAATGLGYWLLWKWIRNMEVVSWKSEFSLTYCSLASNSLSSNPLPLLPSVTLLLYAPLPCPTRSFLSQSCFPFLKENINCETHALKLLVGPSLAKSPSLYWPLGYHAIDLQ